MTTELVEYRFAGCVLNSATREMSVHDEPKQVAPRVLDLLLFLLENRSRVVTKEELMTLLWKSAALSDGVLAQAVRKARFATGDLDPEPRLIKTVHRVGYRFIGEVQCKPLVGPAYKTRPLNRPEQGSAMPRRHKPGVSARGETRAIPGAAPHWLADARVPAGSLAHLRAQPSASITFFVLDDEIALWESAMPATHGVERLDLLLRLAWHLRQRDWRRAVLLADEADALLGSTTDADLPDARARLALVRGEAKWLAGELDEAGDLAKQAIALLWDRDNGATHCDANYLLAVVGIDQGRSAQSQFHFDAALSAASSAGDQERTTVVKLSIAITAVLANAAEGASQWADWVRNRPEGEHLGILALRERFEVVVSGHLTGDAARCLAHCFNAVEASRATGQRRELINGMVNSATRLGLLGDYDAAFEWQESALQLARDVGWPLLIVSALQGGANLLKSVDRQEEAAEFLLESLELLGRFPRSRWLCGTLYYLAFLQFDQKHHALALDSFEQLRAAAVAIDSKHWLTKAADGRARSLAALGRTEEALAIELVVLDETITSGNLSSLPYVFEALAEIYGYPGVRAPDGIAEASATLHFLLRAVEAHESLGKRVVRAGVWELLAAEYARLGDYQRAYEMQLKVVATLLETRANQATDRAIAMKVRHDTERIRAESVHHRALAAAQAERAEALVRTNAILDRLSLIGLEIAKQRGVVAVFDTLERHGHELLDISTLALFVIDETGAALELAFGVESGKPLPKRRIAVDTFESMVARCWRERRELLAEYDGGEPCHHAPGTLKTLSALYAPLMVGARPLGVLTIQSMRAKAYGERERLVFRTLAAYGAIALDHAKAYERLEAVLEARNAAESQT